MLTATADGSVKAEDIQGEAENSNAAELPIKALNPKSMDVKPYMGKNDEEVHGEG